MRDGTHVRKRATQTNETFDFLKEIVEKVPDPLETGGGRGGKRRKVAKSEAQEPSEPSAAAAPAEAGGASEATEPATPVPAVKDEPATSDAAS